MTKPAEIVRELKKGLPNAFPDHILTRSNNHATDQTAGGSSNLIPRAVIDFPAFPFRSFRMRLCIPVLAVALLSASFIARADTVTASAVSTFLISPSLTHCHSTQ